jgi:hypothetical protein
MTTRRNQSASATRPTAKTRQRNVRLPVDLDERFRAAAQERRADFTALLIDAMRSYLESASATTAPIFSEEQPSQSNEQLVNTLRAELGNDIAVAIGDGISNLRHETAAVLKERLAELHGQVSALFGDAIRAVTSQRASGTSRTSSIQPSEILGAKHAGNTGQPTEVATRSNLDRARISRTALGQAPLPSRQLGLTTSKRNPEELSRSYAEGALARTKKMFTQEK